MELLTHPAIKPTLVVLASFGLYSVLWRENKFYRFWEHVFLGLASGWALFTLWAETLKPSWYDLITGVAKTDGDPGRPGYWAWVLLLPIGLMGYLVFNKKLAWMSRIPIGIILGLWSGQQVSIWWNTYGPQIRDSVNPILPTTWSPLTVPAKTAGMSEAQLAEIASNVYLSQAIRNGIGFITILAVLSYFIFSVDFKSKFLQGSSKLGRYLLMIGFGAIFGSTVMMRFTLLIDRMDAMWVKWLKEGMIERQYFQEQPNQPNNGE